MFARLLTVLLLCGGLSLPISASALDYAGVAEINWASLIVSGIPIQVEAMSPNQTSVSAFLHDSNGFHFQDQNASDFIADRTAGTSFPGIGSAIGNANAQALTASVQLVTLGDASASAVRSPVNFQALASGPLTLSVQYTLHHAGIPSLATSEFSTTLNAAIGFAVGHNGAETTGASLTQLSSQAQQSGTLTVTHQFQAGEQGNTAWA